jgi:hypothetical protein
MEMIFEAIEIQTSNFGHMNIGARHQSMRSRPRVTSSVSSEGYDYWDAPANAAIGDEQADQQQRLQDMRRRTVELEALFFEDYGTPLAASSRGGFECFMRYSPMVGTPLLGAEPDGALVATWSKGKECLSLRFADRYHLDYAVTYIDKGDERRRWGKSTLGNVFSECPEAKRLAST